MIFKSAEQHDVCRGSLVENQLIFLNADNEKKLELCPWKSSHFNVLEFLKKKCINPACAINSLMYLFVTSNVEKCPVTISNNFSTRKTISTKVYSKCKITGTYSCTLRVLV